jgi:hypothetical protein
MTHVSSAEINRLKGLYDDAMQRGYAANDLSARLGTAAGSAHGTQAIKLARQANTALQQATAAQTEALGYLKRALRMMG